MHITLTLPKNVIRQAHLGASLVNVCVCTCAHQALCMFNMNHYRWLHTSSIIYVCASCVLVWNNGTLTISIFVFFSHITIIIHHYTSYIYNYIDNYPQLEDTLSQLYGMSMWKTEKTCFSTIDQSSGTAKEVHFMLI